jgi:hypothetical protein
MSLSNPTGKDFLQVHAARLRGMAEIEQVELNEWLESIKSLEDHPLAESYTEYAEQQERKAAALLAGAEALEAVEEVRKALALADSMRLAFDDLVAYAERYAPKSPHEGACTPESGCDAICAELSDLGYAVRLSDKMSKQYAAALARLEGK